MRIGLVVPGFSADVSDWCIPALRHFVQRLAQTEDVRVLALRYPYRADRYQMLGAEVTALGGGQRQGLGSVNVWRRALAALVGEHRRRRFDVLHAFWANETGAVTAIAGRLLGVPTIVSLAGGELVGLRDLGYGGQLARTERQKVRLAITLADRVTAGSRYLLALAAPRLPSHASHRLHRLPLGVDLDLFRPGESPNGGLPRLVHVASLSPVKDQATLLQAAARLRAAGGRFVLELIGEGPLERPLRAEAASLGLGDAVRFRGAVPHADLPLVYQQAALFVLSSRHEAQGMSVLEAAASGLPIVGTQVGVAPELAPEAAIIAPVRDPDALAEGIAQVLADSAQQVAMGRAARARVAAEFGLAESVDRFRQLCAALLTQR